MAIRGTELVLIQVVATMTAFANTYQETFLAYYYRCVPCLKNIFQSTTISQLPLLRGKSIKSVSLSGRGGWKVETRRQRSHGRGWKGRKWPTMIPNCPTLFRLTPVYAKFLIFFSLFMRLTNNPQHILNPYKIIMYSKYLLEKCSTTIVLSPSIRIRNFSDIKIKFFFSKFDSTDKHKTFILIWKYTLFFILLQASKVWAAMLVPHFLKIRKDQNDEFVNMDKLQKKLLGFPHICQTSTNCTGR